MDSEDMIRSSLRDGSTESAAALIKQLHLLLTETTEDGMEALRQTNQHGKMGPGSGMGPSSAGGPSPVPSQQSQGVAALLVMVAVLCFIVAYCCWGAPCCRAFCRRRCAAACCCCRSDLEAASPSDLALSVDQGMVATPTIILLPYGRMLVVDGSVFAQLQADTSGLDLIELGENVVRAQQRQQRATPRTPSSLAASSTPSILEIDTDNGSKDGAISPTFSAHPPPTYESIFGHFDAADLPPSYEEILRQIELHDFSVGSVGDVCEEIEAPENGEEHQSRGDTGRGNETEEDIDEDYEPGEIRESRV